MDFIEQKEDIEFVLKSLLGSSVSNYGKLMDYLALILSDMFEDIDLEWLYKRRFKFAELLTIGDMIVLTDKVRTDYNDNVLCLFALINSLYKAEDRVEVRLFKGISYKCLLESYGEKVPEGTDKSTTLGSLYFDAFSDAVIVPFVERIQDTEERTAFYEEMRLCFIPMMCRIKMKVFPESTLEKALDIIWRFKFDD